MCIQKVDFILIAGRQENVFYSAVGTQFVVAGSEKFWGSVKTKVFMSQMDF